MPAAPIRVLLADDMPDMRMLLRASLDVAGHFAVVGEAGDGRACVELTARHRPDVVVLDLNMPGCGGLQVIRQLRECAPATRVVVLSGMEAAWAEEESLAYGADAFIPKGMAIDRLVDVLRGVVPAGESR
jgi:DNA-binding NarL/FixJ family response regulator